MSSTELDQNIATRAITCDGGQSSSIEGFVIECNDMGVLGCCCDIRIIITSLGQPSELPQNTPLHIRIDGQNDFNGSYGNDICFSQTQLIEINGDPNIPSSMGEGFVIEFPYPGSSSTTGCVEFAPGSVGCS